MIKRYACLLFASLALAACSKGEPPAAALAETAGGRAAPQAEAATAGDQAAPRRYIAVRQHLTVETGTDELAAVWQAVQARCQEPVCELLGATLNQASDFGVPSAVVSVRIRPHAAPAFIASLGKQGKIVEQSIAREDKTDEVIDVEARQKNLAQLRDNLRKMLDTQNAKLADLLAVQKELAEAQAQLDAMAGRRLMLANQTDKVAIDINLQARRSVAERSVFAPLVEAWHNIGHRFMDNVANVLIFVASILPWILLLWLPLLWLRKRWKTWRASRHARKETQA
ncbi:hypothetical protein IGB42_01146 [Andreprevotia sp. IGB-42]|uniref:DUF4349 domain-containing protein n=1 Tax=Andreprevotia sp. IGB-42 TaxID=2497473 RepID=UPI00135B4A3C|nr:DUF4349 domain-containing protein [Andreprevotia sp. IGB-42]KAF0814247.1 hypothetical protein IGB42_01146 [Andreprevotia sp. IGB-42]